MPVYGLLAAIDGHLAATFSDVAVIGISHFAGTVDDASHDGNDHILEVTGPLLHGLERLLQIVHRPSATGAGDVFRTIEPAPAGLKEFVRKIGGEGGFQIREGDRVDRMVQQRLPEIAGRFKDDLLARREAGSDGAIPGRGVAVREILCYWKFILRRFRKRNPHGISNSFLQQRGNGRCKMQLRAH